MCSPLLSGLKQAPPDTHAAKVGVDVPALKVGDWDGGRALDVIVADGHFGETRETALWTDSDKDDAMSFGVEELADLQEMPSLRAIGPEGLPHSKPLGTVLENGGTDDVFLHVDRGVFRARMGFANESSPVIRGDQQITDSQGQPVWITQRYREVIARQIPQGSPAWWRPWQMAGPRPK